MNVRLRISELRRVPHNHKHALTIKPLIKAKRVIASGRRIVPDHVSDRPPLRTWSVDHVDRRPRRLYTTPLSASRASTTAPAARSCATAYRFVSETRVALQLIP